MIFNKVVFIVAFIVVMGFIMRITDKWMRKKKSKEWRAYWENRGKKELEIMSQTIEDEKAYLNQMLLEESTCFPKEARSFLRLSSGQTVCESRVLESPKHYNNIINGLEKEGVNTDDFKTIVMQVANICLQKLSTHKKLNDRLNYLEKQQNFNMDTATTYMMKKLYLEIELKDLIKEILEKKCYEKYRDLLDDLKYHRNYDSKLLNAVYDNKDGNIPVHLSIEGVN